MLINNLYFKTWTNILKFVWPLNFVIWHIWVSPKWRIVFWLIKHVILLRRFFKYLYLISFAWALFFIAIIKSSGVGLQFVHESKFVTGEEKVFFLLFFLNIQLFHMVLSLLQKQANLLNFYAEKLKDRPCPELLVRSHLSEKGFADSLDFVWIIVKNVSYIVEVWLFAFNLAFS